jgi:hypothetical protein
LSQRASLDLRPHSFRPESAVHADRQQWHIGERIPKRLDRLAADERQPLGPLAITGTARRILAQLGLQQARLEVERVNERLRQQQIDARLDQRLHLFVVRIDHRVERRPPPGRVIDSR